MENVREELSVDITRSIRQSEPMSGLQGIDGGSQDRRTTPKEDGGAKNRRPSPELVGVEPGGKHS